MIYRIGSLKKQDRTGMHSKHNGLQPMMYLEASSDFFVGIGLFQFLPFFQCSNRILLELEDVIGIGGFGSPKVFPTSNAGYKG
ncbi:hypothetical protein RclHR1_05700001 [Rhizophagus clarus]|uniref:Uncharacterized protein n=1 Tax=Rhizophagus clarus TaxID=94130 RepID=A0A2Z6RNY3_9GLOM|nr:hypothetical protein RclHR1_05700001 [Rhizophagus clarus]